MSRLNELNHAANELKSAGRIDEAIAAFRAIVDLAPTNPVVMHNLAAALGDGGRYLEAIEWAKRAIDAGIAAPETWLVLGRAYAGAERPDEAIKAIRRAIERKPQDHVAQKELAQLIWMTTGDRAAALKALNAAIEAHPAAHDLRIVRAQVIGQTGDEEGEYREVLEVRKLGGAGHPALELAASNSALAAGRFAVALGHARAAFAGAPDDPAIGQAMCRALLSVGETIEAARLISRLRARFPLDQFYVALQATAWRMMNDARADELYNYERFVRAAPLSCPSGWPSAERYVDDLVDTLDRRHQYKTHPFGQSVRRGSQLPSINQIDDPVLNVIGEAVKGPIQSYIDRLGAGGDPLSIRNRGGYRLFSIWSIRLNSSGHHINHVHPQGWLSSASHLRFPTPKNEDDRSGWLKFGEPGVPTLPTLAPQHFVKPAKGVMVVFPSYMWHGTVPFDSETTRLSIAADSLPASI